MPAATAAFSDSTLTVGIFTPVARAARSDRTPLPSPPITMAQAPPNLASAIESLARASAAYARLQIRGRNFRNHGQSKRRTRRRPQAFRIGGVDRALEKHCTGGSEGLRCSQNGSGISGILHAIKNYHQRRHAHEIIRAPLRQADQSQHSLGRFGRRQLVEQAIQDAHNARVPADGDLRRRLGQNHGMNLYPAAQRFVQ